MFDYETKDDALRGAVYSLREAGKRSELPTWLRLRLGREADACKKALTLSGRGEVAEPRHVKVP